MTANQVKTHLREFLEKPTTDLNALRAWIFPFARDAHKYGCELEILVDSVGYLLGRYAAGLMPEPNFRERLRVLSGNEASTEKLSSQQVHETIMSVIDVFSEESMVSPPMGDLSSMKYRLLPSTRLIALGASGTSVTKDTQNSPLQDLSFVVEFQETPALPRT